MLNSDTAGTTKTMSFIWGRPVAVVSQVICVIAAITVLLICISMQVPLSTDTGLAIRLGPVISPLALMIAAQMFFGRTRFSAIGINFALFAVISLLGAITSAAVAVGHDPYIDSWLVFSDHCIAPWYDWPAVAIGLTKYPILQLIVGYLYITLNWQPILLFGAFSIGLIPLNRLDRFVAAWGLSLVATLIAFHWLPAKGAYVYYGIQISDLPGMPLALPWRYPEALANLRVAHPIIDSNSTLGIVTVPSFHACAAVLLAWGFAQSRLLRWPMILINAGMAASAVTMGGHYLTDIVTGVFVALGSIIFVSALDGEPVCRQKPWGIRRKSALAVTLIKQSV